MIVRLLKRAEAVETAKAELNSPTPASIKLLSKQGSCSSFFFVKITMQSIKVAIFLIGNAVFSPFYPYYLPIGIWTGLTLS